MKELLKPEKIQKALKNGDLNKENATERLILLIEESNSTELRVESIKTLEKIQVFTNKIFRTLENSMISDENAIVRASAANFIIRNFLEDSLPALKWIIQHEKSPLPLKVIFDSVDNFNSPQWKLIKKDLINWDAKFSSKIGVIPQESKFFLDLEALFAKGKRNYEIDPLSYKYFETLSDIKNGEPWLVITDKHVEILNFNYFKWNFVKNNTDIINSLYKLQDLDVYLYSLKKYSSNDIIISSIPESIGSLIYLKKLILRRNGLNKLPFSLRKLSQLKEIDLSYNKLKEIPHFITSLKVLEMINIRHNNVQNIPESLSHHIKVIR